jgi:ArsR family transcriptional regulator, lead/cadmium/zinc/bismuth-responsive transcriptional repressor
MRNVPCAIQIPASAGKPSLRERPLTERPRADELGRVFKMLASGTRLRVLHALERAGELCVSDLAAEVEMTPQAISNQLQRLADRRIVACRREGNRLLYRVADPCVSGLLDLGLCLLEESQKVQHRAKNKRGARR